MQDRHLCCPLLFPWPVVPPPFLNSRIATAPKRLQLQGHDSRVCYFFRQLRIERNETVARKDVRFRPGP